MSRSDPDWEEFVAWMRERPRVVQELAREWPLGAVVRARPGVVLLVPAPGVEGEIGSYFENGGLGVLGPVTIPHPIHGWGATEPGEIVSAECRPEQLEIVREGRWSREDVTEALR